MIMIGVSTSQNITNLIPSVQKSMGVDKFVLLETTTAKKAKWSEGITKVLKNRNVEVELIDLEGIDTHISKIQQKITDRFQYEKQPLIWNLGGGQKPQQIPLWEIFKWRNEKMNIPDIVCYANQNDTGLLEIWEFQNGTLTTRTEQISVDLSAEEIFNTFGFDFSNKPKLIYHQKRAVSFERIKDCLKDQGFREFLFKLPIHNEEIKNKPLSLNTIDDILKKESRTITDLLAKVFTELIKILDKEKNGIENYLKIEPYTVNKIYESLKKADFRKQFFDLIKQNLPHESIELHNETVKEEFGKPEIPITSKSLQTLTDGKYDKASFYVEHIVIQRVVKLLESTNHNIIEAYANLETKKNGQEQNAAEYDVLCVTKRGTILALDAKTFKFENKDIDARLYNLEQGSGFYRNFSAVFPFDWDDINKPWLKPMVTLLFRLNKKKLNFFVISDSYHANFWVKEENEMVLRSKEKPQGKDWVECKILDHFVKQN